MLSTVKVDKERPGIFNLKTKLIDFKFMYHLCYMALS